MQIVNDLELAGILKETSKPVLVDFFADWCGPCKMLAPIISEVAEENAGDAAFYKVNIDQSPNTAAELGIMSIPTVVLFKNGKVVDQTVGLRPKQFYVDLVKQNS